MRRRLRAAHQQSLSSALDDTLAEMRRRRTLAAPSDEKKSKKKDKFKEDSPASDPDEVVIDTMTPHPHQTKNHSSGELHMDEFLESESDSSINPTDEETFDALEDDYHTADASLLPRSLTRVYDFNPSILGEYGLATDQVRFEHVTASI